MVTSTLRAFSTRWYHPVSLRMPHVARRMPPIRGYCDRAPVELGAVPSIRVPSVQCEPAARADHGPDVLRIRTREWREGDTFLWLMSHLDSTMLRQNLKTSTIPSCRSFAYSLTNCLHSLHRCLPSNQLEASIDIGQSIVLKCAGIYETAHNRFPKCVYGRHIKR